MTRVLSQPKGENNTNRSVGEMAVSLFTPTVCSPERRPNLGKYKQVWVERVFAETFRKT